MLIKEYRLLQRTMSLLESSAPSEKEFNIIDNIRSMCRNKADKTCRRLCMGIKPWSPTYGLNATKCRYWYNVWKRTSQIINYGRSNIKIKGLRRLGAAAGLEFDTSITQDHAASMLKYARLIKQSEDKMADQTRNTFLHELAKA